MGADEWLKRITKILEAEGIPCIRAFLKEPAPHMTEATAAVGLRDLDWEKGSAFFTVRILSPRTSGGWTCQRTAVRAVTALETAGIRTRMGQMEYRRGCDCMEVPLTAELIVREAEPEKPVPRAWKIAVGGTELPFAVEFEEEEDLKRRMVGAMGEMRPVSVTPGSGGWKLHLVQKFPAGTAEPQLGPEPLEVTVTREGRTIRYTGCCRNCTRRSFADGVLTVESQGFALGRTEEAANG